MVRSADASKPRDVTKSNIEKTCDRRRFFRAPTGFVAMHNSGAGVTAA
jgi:hypothetical protein